MLQYYEFYTNKSYQRDFQHDYHIKICKYQETQFNTWSKILNGKTTTADKILYKITGLAINLFGKYEKVKIQRLILGVLPKITE